MLGMWQFVGKVECRLVTAVFEEWIEEARGVECWIGPWLKFAAIFCWAIQCVQKYILYQTNHSMNSFFDEKRLLGESETFKRTVFWMWELKFEFEFWYGTQLCGVFILTGVVVCIKVCLFAISCKSNAEPGRFALGSNGFVIWADAAEVFDWISKTLLFSWLTASIKPVFWLRVFVLLFGLLHVCVLTDLIVPFPCFLIRFITSARKIDSCVWETEIVVFCACREASNSRISLKIHDKKLFGKYANIFLANSRSALSSKEAIPCWDKIWHISNAMGGDDVVLSWVVIFFSWPVNDLCRISYNRWQLHVFSSIHHLIQSLKSKYCLNIIQFLHFCFELYCNIIQRNCCWLPGPQGSIECVCCILGYEMRSQICRHFDNQSRLVFVKYSV